MEEEKQLLENTRSLLKSIEGNVTKLDSMGLELTLDVGTNSKTVTFQNTKHIEFTLHAKINQDL
jgi:hypothetical protein